MAVPHRKLLDKYIGNRPIILQKLCGPFCDEGLNPAGVCPLTCLSFCNSTCRIPLIPEFQEPPPPPTTTNMITSTSNKPIWLFLFLSISLAGLAIILVFIIYMLYTRRRRSSQQQQLEGEEESGPDELDPGPGPIEHYIWLIRTIGLQQSVISEITVVKYNKEDGFVEGTDCSICLSEFQENESLRLLPKCNHAFHVPCIDTWLRSHTNCPVCRAGMIVRNAELILPPPHDELIVQNLVGVSDSSSRREFGNSGLNTIGIPALQAQIAIKNDEDH